ncbi:hypothetical protein ES332_D06G202800v1 [Gossypium tomentosum]|uniref:Uncharacterized protein n=1 Tax=Gossypium tomentosum TaxID=34277 RepID=A0A5D2KNG4_GOSTO|nr:hypothetical protein ES332_D06G202800v1 [Gossypium tomentosum]
MMKLRVICRNTGYTHEDFQLPQQQQPLKINQALFWVVVMHGCVKISLENPRKGAVRSRVSDSCIYTYKRRRILRIERDM